MNPLPFGQLASRIAGELHAGDTLRRLYATDASEYQKLRALLADPENRRQITGNFPRPSIPRRNTGYALDLLMDADVFDATSAKPFNLYKLIAGFEGTLFFATEIELDCSPLPPPHAALIARKLLFTAGAHEGLKSGPEIGRKKLLWGAPDVKAIWRRSGRSTSNSAGPWG
ncbi:MAG: hypothetical protein K9N23_21795 [Akkermansiaceae bacterium]|nr:hypothetical protein [Akkermansiaceae bacterium]